MALKSEDVVAGLRAIAMDGKRLEERLEEVAARYASANKALEQAKAALKMATEAEDAEETAMRAIAEAAYAESKENKNTPKGVLTAGDAAGRKAQMDQHLALARRSGAGPLAGAYIQRQKLEAQLMQVEAEHFTAKVLFDALKARGAVYAASAELLKSAASIESVQQIGWMQSMIDLLKQEKEPTQ